MMKKGCKKRIFPIEFWWFVLDIDFLQEIVFVVCREEKNLDIFVEHIQELIQLSGGEVVNKQENVTDCISSNVDIENP